jgi:hypothetical protein
MKILITERQYFNILVEQQMEMEFPSEITVNFTDFNPDTKKQKTYVYINGMSDSDKIKIKELKDLKSNTKVILSSGIYKKNFNFTLENINFTKTIGSFPYIDISEYEKIRGELDTTDNKLDEKELKKFTSGFPKFMTETLYNLYPNNLGKNSFKDGNDGICNSEVGLINIPDTDVPGQTWSILNYFDTNPMVIRKLIEWYMQGVFKNMVSPKEVTIENFKQWIKDNSKSLFKDGNYLKELVKINLKSYNNGVKTENLAIEKLTKPPYNIGRDKIKQYCSGSKLDRDEGKDIEIITPNGIKFVQIKPLKWVKFKEETDEYVLESWHMKNYKNKPLDYIIFVNSNEMKIFKNKNYMVDNKNPHIVIFKNPPVSNIE